MQNELSTNNILNNDLTHYKHNLIYYTSNNLKRNNLTNFNNKNKKILTSDDLSLFWLANFHNYINNKHNLHYNNIYLKHALDLYSSCFPFIIIELMRSNNARINSRL